MKNENVIDGKRIILMPETGETRKLEEAISKALNDSNWKVFPVDENKTPIIEGK